MIELMGDTGDGLRDFIAVISYHLPRAAAFMWFFPLFAKGYTSPFIKAAVGATLVMYPALASTEFYTVGIAVPSFNVLTFVSEILLGVLLGLTIALPYHAFKGFGALVDVYRGATFSAQVSGNDSGEELPLETLFGLLFAALMFAGPGLHAVTVHLLQSYLLMPPGTLVMGGFDTWITTLMRLTADSIAFAVLLSGPVLIAILVVELAVEIVSAFAQQLQVYSLEYGLRSVFGIAALLALMHYAEDEIFHLFRNYSESLFLLLEGMQ
ncbi:EscT/YscT/HrcT family type III secretion system export apparatus protein [Limnobacter parvus]|uniref:Flagellar biosynthetic protein FliR n=1 Tax=Limnobacter parvus TaxID=2939690 RepID=A0ABT1XIZ0_9BURK|nr:flagellar biosynthetic protein FliR [Limnobacter parvus]MCR2747248.1 flagellar biosynthetic protein FliR [Limnobacter parvus]